MQIMITENDKVTITSRDIAEITNKEHKHVKRDIEVALGEDATKFGRIYKDSMNRDQTEYVLPKNMAIGIVSGYSFDLRMKIINRLEQLENERKNLFAIPQTYSEALMIAAKQAEQIEQQTKQLEYQKPLVSFAETVSSTINSMLIRDWAKSIGIPEQKCRKWLHEKGHIYKQGNKWRMYASENGYFEQIQSTHSHPNGTFLEITVKITGKGQTSLTEKIKKDLING